jgi:hypothetical protein
MTKLIAKYLADPSLKNAQAIAAHARKHPMSVCLLMPADCGIVQAATVQANGI